MNGVNCSTKNGNNRGLAAADSAPKADCASTELVYTAESRVLTSFCSQWVAGKKEEPALQAGVSRSAGCFVFRVAAIYEMFPEVCSTPAGPSYAALQPSTHRHMESGPSICTPGKLSRSLPTRRNLALAPHAPICSSHTALTDSACFE